jgi:hypothetical protein
VKKRTIKEEENKEDLIKSRYFFQDPFYCAISTSAEREIKGSLSHHFYLYGRRRNFRFEGLEANCTGLFYWQNYTSKTGNPSIKVYVDLKNLIAGTSASLQ